ncbi:hypothetical protein ABH961_000195 [Bacillus sp. RC251]
MVGGHLFNNGSVMYFQMDDTLYYIDAINM